MFSKIATLAATLSTASALYTGFNYGSTNTDGSAVTQDQFTNLFTTAKALPGTNGEYTAARLYTMIQAGTTNGVISAIPAAINTNTYLLLGMWASAGQADFDNEMAALNAAITQYGSAFTNLIAAVSVGSEDLYRITPTGIENNSGAGAEPAELVSYINQVRGNLTSHSVTAPITHVDTWTAWVNGTNNPVIEAVDFLSMDAYPYFQNTENNDISQGSTLFYDALDATAGAAQGKTVWITETGWPVSGPTQNLAVANTANAQAYWDAVQCTAQGTYNLFWYTLQDSYPTTPSPSFGIVGSTLSDTPLYNLACSASSSSSSSTTASSTSTSIPASTATTATFSATSAPLSSTATTIVGSGSLTSVSASAPASSAPVSSTPVSSAPASSTPASSAPASSTPASSAPASSTPASSTPASSVPASSAPASSAPVSSAPASSAPVSSAPASSAPVSSAPASSTASVPASTPVSIQQSSTFVTSVKPTSTATTAPVSAPASGSPSGTPVSASVAPAPTAGQCTTDILSGVYEYPHLIVPVDSTQPDTAFGTSYDGEFSSAVSSIFNFDIPYSDAGKTCTLVFLFPTQAQLETSSYTISGMGGLHIQELSSAATQQTTYDNVAAPAGVDVTLPSVQPGNSYVVASHECGAGEVASFMVSATGDLQLSYFQDYNPSPIGFYVSVC